MILNIIIRNRHVVLVNHETVLVFIITVLITLCPEIFELQLKIKKIMYKDVKRSVYSEQDDF